MEHYRWITHLVGQARPVQIVGVPGLGQKSAGVAEEGGKGFNIQQLPTVRLRERGMRHAKILGHSFPAYFLRKTLRETLEFLADSTAIIAFLRKSSSEPGCQIEGLGG